MCILLQTDNHINTSSFIWARCSSWCPTNSFKAMKATYSKRQQNPTTVNTGTGRANVKGKTSLPTKEEWGPVNDSAGWWQEEYSHTSLFCKNHHLRRQSQCAFVHLSVCVRDKEGTCLRFSHFCTAQLCGQVISTHEDHAMADTPTDAV